MNLFTKQKQIQRHRKQIYGCQREREWGRDKSGIWDQQIHTIYIKEINNKDLLYSTGNYIQYLIMYNGNDSKRIYIYV